MSVSICVASGKGGAGKSTVTANLGACLARRGHSVVIIDTDIGLRSQDALLSLENQVVYDLVDVASKDCRLDQALLAHPSIPGLSLLPASQFARVRSLEPERLRKILKELLRSSDFVLVDCPAGIEQGYETAVIGADWAIVVTNPEISAVRDADKIIGRLQAANKEIKLIVNRIRPQMVKDGTMLDMTAIDDILSLECIGQVPDDDKVVDSANRGVPVVESKDSAAGDAYRDIVGRVCGEDIPFKELAPESFWQRLKHVFKR